MVRKSQQLFLTVLQADEDFLVLLQNRVKKLATELTPFSLGNLAGLELAEHDVVFVLHRGYTLQDFRWEVNSFF